MRKLLYCCILLAFWTNSFAKTKPDTLGSWQVTYNGKEILGVVINGVRTYLIDSIADNSTITIDYYTDYPCEKCQALLQFRNEDSKALASVSKMGVGDGPTFKLPGMQFRQLMHDHKLFLFYRNQIDGWGPWMFVGLVKTMR
jgi:hypothetical protein